MNHTTIQTDEGLYLRYNCADLLEAPAPQVVRELIDEIRRLRKNLN